MTIRCEKVRELLDRFYDHELRGRKRVAVSEHLRRCENCSSELEKLERMGQMLKAHCEELAGSEDLSVVWERVCAAIEEPAAPEPEPLMERLVRVFWLPKPAWAAVAAVAVALVLVLAYIPGNQAPTLAANDCIIDSVDAANDCVMVYEVGDTKMKVIWVVEERAGESKGEEGVAL
jgi:anti-sigma factor RsiW